jgi:hypothetical protein
VAARTIGRRLVLPDAQGQRLGLIPAAELALARRDLSEEQYLQEFECSFDAAVVGSYYGKLMAQAELDKRIAGVPYDPSALVWTTFPDLRAKARPRTRGEPTQLSLEFAEEACDEAATETAKRRSPAKRGPGSHE